jgi:UDP-glucose 4-epimerase
MNCLVTGGCGFIGSHIVDYLINNRYTVTVIDDESATSNEKFYKNKKAKYYKYSINNFKKIKPLFKDIDLVFHLASESRIGPSLETPNLSCLTNVVGTCNVLQAAQAAKVKRLVYSSTSACYGLKNKSPLKETMSHDNLNPYSLTKMAGEELVIMFHKLWGLPTVCLRYFNVYGERMPSTGPYAPVLGIFLKQKKDNQPLTIVGDGKQKRDFIHVQDIVTANIKAALVNNESCLGQAFNIGTGKNITILELAETIEKNKSMIKHLPERIGEARNTLANISKAKKNLKFQPSYDVKEWLINQVL